MGNIGPLGSGRPSPRGSQQCNWCTAKDTVAVELLTGRGKGRSIYVYACDVHSELAEKMGRIASR